VAAVLVGRALGSRTHPTATATSLQQLAALHAAKPWAAGVARLLLASGASAQPQRVNARAPAACVPAGPARDSELYRLLLEAEGEGA
jgi:hypothetical protein